MTARNWQVILADAVERGLHQADLARELGVSPVAVMNHERATGIVLLKCKGGRKSPRDWPKIITLAIAEQTQVRTIAKAQDVTVQAVRGQAKRRGYYVAKGVICAPVQQAEAA